MVRRLGLGKNNHLTYDSLALNPRYLDLVNNVDKRTVLAETAPVQVFSDV